MFLIIILHYAVTLLPLFNKTVTKNLTKTKIFFPLEIVGVSSRA